MLNHIDLMGRLVRDPEIRYTQNQTPVTTFTIACERDFSGRGEDKQTDFINCVAWRKTAEFVHQHFTKGSMIALSGRLQIRDWTDKDGNKRQSAEVIPDSVYFAESRKRDGESNYTAPAENGRQAATQPVSVQYEDLEDAGGDLPF